MRVQSRWGGVVVAVSMALGPLAVPGSARAQDQEVPAPVVTLTLATAIEDGRPVGVDSTFSADVGEIWAVVEIGDGHEGKLWVVFDFLGSQSLLELEVDETSRLRWAAMTIPPEAKGQWAVSVVRDGTTLASKLFSVGQ